MKMLTEEQLGKMLCMAYRDGMIAREQFGSITLRDEQIDFRMKQIIHADAGGFDGEGIAVGENGE